MMSENSFEKKQGRGRGRGKRQEANDLHHQITKAHFVEFGDGTTSFGGFGNNASQSKVTYVSNNDVDDNVIKKVFHHYQDDFGGASDAERTHLLIRDSMTPDANTCLICIESIEKKESVWSCRNCFGMFHLNCIMKWSKDNIYYQSLKEDVSEDEIKWSCPKCRQEYKKEEKPNQYYCFCKKELDPRYEPWLVPHSCGQTCEKLLEPYCGHKCLLLCHPGPCPPCPKTVRANCYCGKTDPIIRRCSNKEWSCGKICNGLLSCKEHKCRHVCHEGACAPCSKQSEQRCQCGRSTKVRPCDDLIWQCGQVCGKPLTCGNHLCSIICHPQKCSPCPKQDPRPCPCGKTVLQLPCTEEVLPCGDTCDKLLECKIHQCSQRCHFGSCSDCLQMRVMKCRCGQREKSVPCCKEFICETKCKRYRDCAKHVCNRKCCNRNCPPCEVPCGRQLRCGNHKCKSRCHQGPCFPCPEVADIACSCGATKITVPCGKKKHTKPPKCKKLCKRPSNCHHVEQENHLCHDGPCPSCRQVCNKTLSCGHTCPAACHTSVKIKVIPNQKRAGPWEPPVAPHAEVVCKPCPPCCVPIPVYCLGKHQSFDFPCFESQPRSCGKSCGRQLSCTNHTCIMECHIVTNAPNGYEAGDDCEHCEELCTKARPEGCTHPCTRLCHPGECAACQQRIRLQCHCHLNTLYISCQEWTSASLSQKDAMKSCQNRCPKEMICGHRCPMKCHSGDCASTEICKKKVVIRCACKRLKKEIPCNIKAKEETIVECDDVCSQEQSKLKALKEAEEQRKNKEALERQHQELEDFQRKMEGKKKKHKKSKESVKKFSWYQEYFYVILIAFIIAALAIFVYFIQ